MYHASYLKKIFDKKEQDKAIKSIKELIKQWDLTFDGFVVTGVSGVSMGSILSRILKKDLVIVRKANDGTHSSYTVENHSTGKRYIFLDDLIASGNTYRNVAKAIEDCHTGYFKRIGEKKSQIIGGILYDAQGLPSVQYVGPRRLRNYINHK